MKNNDPSIYFYKRRRKKQKKTNKLLGWVSGWYTGETRLDIFDDKDKAECGVFLVFCFSKQEEMKNKEDRVKCRLYKVIDLSFIRERMKKKRKKRTLLFCFFLFFFFKVKLFSTFFYFFLFRMLREMVAVVKVMRCLVSIFI